MPRPATQALPETLVEFLARIASLNARQRAQGFEYTPIGARENLDLVTRQFVTRIPDLPWIRDTLVTGSDPTEYPVPVRIYHPRPDLELPVMVFAHGGGHMAGSVSVYDAIARKLALAAQRVLVSVDYRLAPECPFPLGLADLKHVLRYLFPTLRRLRVRHLARLAVVGDSAGGALTASAVHELAPEEEILIEQQVLIYPSLDYTLSSTSMTSFGEGYLLERQRVAWLFDQYFRAAEDRKKASPAYMPLPERYPETLLVTAGYCPLLDEGLAYGERLAHAGHAVENLHFGNMIHAFLNLEDLVPDACHAFYLACGRFLRGA